MSLNSHDLDLISVNVQCNHATTFDVKDKENTPNTSNTAIRKCVMESIGSIDVVPIVSFPGYNGESNDNPESNPHFFEVPIIEVESFGIRNSVVLSNSIHCAYVLSGSTR